MPQGGFNSFKKKKGRNLVQVFPWFQHTFLKGPGKCFGVKNPQGWSTKGGARVFLENARVFLTYLLGSFNHFGALLVLEGHLGPLLLRGFFTVWGTRGLSPIGG